jgi:hypothetical protein
MTPGWLTAAISGMKDDYQGTVPLAVSDAPPTRRYFRRPHDGTDPQEAQVYSNPCNSMPEVDLPSNNNKPP